MERKWKEAQFQVEDLQCLAEARDQAVRERSLALEREKKAILDEYEAKVSL